MGTKRKNGFQKCLNIQEKTNQHITRGDGMKLFDSNIERFKSKKQEDKFNSRKQIKTIWDECERTLEDDNEWKELKLLEDPICGKHHG